MRLFAMEAGVHLEYLIMLLIFSSIRVIFLAVAVRDVVFDISGAGFWALNPVLAHPSESNS